MKIVIPRFPRYTLLAFGTTCIVLIAFVPSYYFYTKYQESKKLLRNPSGLAAEEQRALVAHVGNIIELPSGEQPTIATVADKTKLQNQPFFLRSENGDKVLIFQQSKKAILFRPSSGKVIEVSTLSFTNDAVTTRPATSSAAEAQVAKVALYNGSLRVGLTASAEKKLQSDSELGSRKTIVSKENAAKKDYTKTIVVVFNALYSTEGENLAKLFGGTVAPLPKGEASSSADIAVFIAK